MIHNNIAVHKNITIIHKNLLTVSRTSDKDITLF
jgi:hypothetical protein